MKKDIKSVEELYAAQQKEWRAFRWFWSLMACVLLAAVLGVFGYGFISERTYTGAQLQVAYPKFMRVDSDTQLHLRVQDLGQNATVGINQDYLNKVKISQIVPEPVSVALDGNTLIYKFSYVRNGVITFFIDPYKMGSQRLKITVAGEKMSFQQYIYL